MAAIMAPRVFSTARPRKPKRYPPTSAPRPPIAILPIKPNPFPRMTFPNTQPAIKPTSKNRSKAIMCLNILEQMRLFIAINLPGTVQRAIQQNLSDLLPVVQECGSQVRWGRPEQFHITLKFIGEQPKDRLAPLQKTLTDVLRTQPRFS